jgi:DNA-3-methyladenine glycosylase
MSNIEFSRELLPQNFYDRPSEIVAKDLLGKILVRRFGSTIISGQIVEVEAYLSFTDEAAHSFKGLTKRTAPLFGPAGHAYVYSIHQQNCLDIVCQGIGTPESVLIRALEPIHGVELMKKFRKKDNLKDLCSGPGKLTQALSIDKSFNNAAFFDIDSQLYIIVNPNAITQSTIGISRRIGISKAKELELRFFIKESKYLSR